MDISTLIQNLPFELQVLNGEHLGVYFPSCIETLKAVLNKENYKKYVSHVVERDNDEQLLSLLQIIKSWEDCDVRKYLENVQGYCAIKSYYNCCDLLQSCGYHSVGWYNEVYYNVQPDWYYEL